MSKSRGMSLYLAFAGQKTTGDLIYLPLKSARPSTYCRSSITTRKKRFLPENERSFYIKMNTKMKSEERFSGAVQTLQHKMGHENRKVIE